MPHINIKHFPSLTSEQQSEIAREITKIIKHVIRCDEGAISIALEPIDKNLWNEQVYIPEIINRKNLLCKIPNY